MNVTIINSEVQDKGKYKAAVVSYKDDSGKVNQKNIMSFTYPDVYSLLSKAQNGQTYSITSAKNDKGYWDWTAAELGAGAAAAKASTAPQAVRSSYETPEERARKQVYIVKQSSITAALNLFELNKVKAGPDEVIKTAQIFVDYVFDSGVKELPDVEV